MKLQIASALMMVAEVTEMSAKMSFPSFSLAVIFMITANSSPNCLS